MRPWLGKVISSRYCPVVESKLELTAWISLLKVCVGWASPLANTLTSPSATMVEPLSIQAVTTGWEVVVAWGMPTSTPPPP